MDKNTKYGYSFCPFDHKEHFLVIKLSGIAEILVFFTSSPVVSVLDDRHIII